MRSGPPSTSLNLQEDPEAKTAEIVDICSRLEGLMPEMSAA